MEGKKKGGRGQGVALCHVFPWFTVILLKQRYTSANTSEGWKPRSLRAGLRQDRARVCVCWGVLHMDLLIEYCEQLDGFQHFCLMFAVLLRTISVRQTVQTVTDTDKHPK